MLPEGSISYLVIPAPFVGAARLPTTDYLDYEDGPIAIQDPYSGLDYQVWRLRLVGDSLWLTAPNTPEFVFLTIRGLTCLSLAFDQNARPLIAYLLNDVLMLYWYDSQLPGYVHTQFDSGVSSVKIRLDDKRQAFSGSSDVLLSYAKGDTLYCRVQRDRFNTPYVIQQGIGGRLMQAGLNNQWRFQWLLQMTPYTDYAYTPGRQVI